MEALREWIDGPALVRWLEDEGLLDHVRRLGAKGRMEIFRWRNGTAASYFTLERALFEAGCEHLLCSLPNSIYREPPKVGRPPRPWSREAA